MRTLTIEPLTKEAFAPFGDVIETDGSDHFMINNGSTMRFHKLATVETATPDDKAIISIFRADAQDMPLTVSMLERHPLGSQAFIPLLGNPFLIVVAPLGDESGMTSWWLIAVAQATTAMSIFSKRMSV
jgi:ureidoglycolate lyase